FWYVVYHTLFFTDLYLSGSAEGFAPPAPYTLDELDPAGVMPGRVYAKEELLDYLRRCREKCRATVRGLTAERARALCVFRWGEVSFAELLLYNLRHVQHHAGQLNLMLRQETDAAPGWVCSAEGRERGA
ncbi:MAG TPA: DinB family protein, partial [Pyrinomonadaceae bacterium]